MSPRLPGPEDTDDPRSLPSADRQFAPGTGPGAQLGPLRLEERIGAGGLADVWRARPEGQPTWPRVVAVKVLREPERSADHAARFLREGRLLARIGHRSLPRCYAVLEGPRPALVLELLEGESLSARLRREGPLSAPATLQLALDVLAALDGLHELGIIHRDVKASNIFLERSGGVRLIDLGLASDPVHPAHTTVGDVIGTYAYMAPEQLAGAEVDARADLYSLGVTLFEALTGARPLNARGCAGYLRAHRDGQPANLQQLLPEAPTRLVECVSQLMARDPLARPASAVVARAALTGAPLLEAPLRLPPFVGRAAAIGAVEALIDGGGALALLGEPGSGCTRALRFALDQARAAAIEVLALRCRPAAHPNDLQHQLVDQLRARGLHTAPEPAELCRAVEALAGEDELLLSVEDCQLLSAAGAALMQLLRQEAPRARQLFVGERLNAVIDAHRTELRALRVDEVEQVIAAMLGAPTAPAGLAPRLHAQTAGLPTLLVSSVHELVEGGQLFRDGRSEDGRARWRLSPGATLSPTATVERVFGRTIQALPADARALLEVLAVAGDEVPLAAALQLAGADPSGFAALPLERAHLASVERHADGEWLSLRRPAVGALLVESVSADRQHEIHAAIAAALRGLEADPWRDQRIAWHEAHSARPEEAPAALCALGEHLFNEGQVEAALELLERAARQPGSSQELSARLSVLRGEALLAVHRRAEARASLEAGRRHAIRLSAPALQGRALRGLAQSWHEDGDERRAASLADEALALLEDNVQDVNLVKTLCLSGETHHIGGRAEAARQAWTRCAAAAQALGLDALAAQAARGLGALLADEGRVAEAMAPWEAEVALLRGRAHPPQLVPALLQLASGQLRQGRYDLALELIDEADDTARFQRQPYSRAAVQLARAQALRELGEGAGAALAMERARAALEADAPTQLRLGFRALQVELRLDQPDRPAALAICQLAEAEANRCGAAALAAWFLGMGGVLTADSSALDAAMDVLTVSGDRRLLARLLLTAATQGADRELQEAAEREARLCEDLPLLLRALHVRGDSGRQLDARALGHRLLLAVPAQHRASFLAQPTVRWTTPSAPPPTQTR